MMAAPNRAVGRTAVGALLLAASVLVFLPQMDVDLRPGSPIGQSLGILAALLLLGTLAYVFVRRSDRSEYSKPRAQLLHSLVGSLAVGIAVVHSHALLREWSALVFLAVLGLLATGLYGRLLAPQRVARDFGRGALAYTAGGGRATAPELAALIGEKQRIVAALSGGDTAEGQFVLRSRHWLQHPRRAWRHQRLAAAEHALLARNPRGARNLIPVPERFWRRLHLVFAILFILGIFAHVITTVFFAGYVAGGREIYWWHVTAW